MAVTTIHWEERMLSAKVMLAESNKAFLRNRRTATETVVTTGKDFPQVRQAVPFDPSGGVHEEAASQLTLTTATANLALSDQQEEITAVRRTTITVRAQELQAVSQLWVLVATSDTSGSNARSDKKSNVSKRSVAMNWRTSASHALTARGRGIRVMVQGLVDDIEWTPSLRPTATLGSLEAILHSRGTRWRNQAATYLDHH